MRRAAGLAVVAIAATAALASGDAGPSPYSLTDRQAQEVAVAVQFLDAFNAGRLREALALFAPDGQGSDCDFRHVRVILFRGKREIRVWLRRRFADHDYLGLNRVWNENLDEPVGVLALDYAVRRSDTLRSLGFPHGIKPQAGTKVVFTTRRPVRISTFANGPGGASAEFCRPR